MVIMQAANTGLTGGSTPYGDDYDRPVIIMSTRRLQGIQVILDGKQVVCLPGATLDNLERTLKPYNREPHSVIGSSCIGASVLGGVCNNSGGALVRRGPAYTEMALYARVNESGELELINHLGIDLGNTTEEILTRLHKQDYETGQITTQTTQLASDNRYAHDVKQVDADSPARFNADPTRLYEASGSAGKVCVFAVRLDTFEKVESRRLHKQDYETGQITTQTTQLASDNRYAHDVKQVDADSPARFNADPTRLYEASGSAGKVCVFAVRLDTFEKVESRVFYIGSNDHDDLTAIRRYLLTSLPSLPIAGEYIHRDAFSIGAKYGKDTFLFIERFGTVNIPRALALKDRIDGWLEKIKIRGLTDQILQAITFFLPSHLPQRMLAFHQRFEHHLILRVDEQSAEQTQQFLNEYFAVHSTGSYFACTEEEGRKAFLHRFAVAGAAIRYRDTHRAEVEDIVALDIALRRNDREWVEKIPADLEQHMLHKLYYGHFFCHVFHQDYIVKKGTNPLDIEHQMWQLLDERRAEYPAEHNVGHLYVAKPALANFYRKLDPTNTFNVGIGHTSKLKYWGKPNA